MLTLREATPPFICHAPWTRTGDDAASAQVGVAGEPVATRSCSRTVVAHPPLPTSTKSSLPGGPSDALHVAGAWGAGELGELQPMPRNPAAIAMSQWRLCKLSTGPATDGHCTCGLAAACMYNSPTVRKSTPTLSLAFAAAMLASALASLLASACGSSNSNSDFNPGGGGADATADGAGRGDSGNLIGNGDGGSGSETGAGTVLSSVHIVPANSSISVQAGQTKTQAFKVMGLVDGATTETDVTSRFVFWVPDNYLVGDFPANGGPLFSTRLPTAAEPILRSRAAC